jgi:hypothetical protein
VSENELTSEQRRILEEWGTETVRFKLYTPTSTGSGLHPPSKIRVDTEEVSRVIVENWLIETRVSEEKNNLKMQKHLYWFALLGALFGFIGIVVGIVIALIQK